LYSYRIPNEILDVIEVGSRIKVPFNSRSCEAIVVDLSTSEEPLGNLKVIESLLGEIPIANQAIITFYSQMAKYWASDPYSIIKSGVPARVASVEKLMARKENYKFADSRSSKKIEKTYLMQSPYASSYVELANLVANTYPGPTGIPFKRPLLVTC
jgi:primosomal protein N'